MFIKVFKSFQVPGLVEQEVGREGWGLPIRVSEPDRATERTSIIREHKGRCLVRLDREQTDCNKALVPYLCGSPQLLRTDLLFPGSQQAPQSHWAVVICNQGCKEGT